MLGQEEVELWCRGYLVNEERDECREKKRIAMEGSGSEGYLGGSDNQFPPFCVAPAKKGVDVVLSMDLGV